MAEWRGRRRGRWVLGVVVRAGGRGSVGVDVCGAGGGVAPCSVPPPGRQHPRGESQPAARRPRAARAVAASRPTVASEPTGCNIAHVTLPEGAARLGTDARCRSTDRAAPPGIVVTMRRATIGRHGTALADPLQWYARHGPRPALARARRRRVGGAGQRGHAAADAGGPGAAACTAPGWRAGRRRPRWRPTSPGEAVRMWGKLGYPRRALRLHECAR